MIKANILITGGSGFVGTRLTEILIEKGYTVSHLSRKQDLNHQIKKFKWDPANNFIDLNSLQNIDHIVNLAGAGVADKRWTDERKAEILSSRINSSKLLYETLSANSHKVKSVITASAIGYYGFSSDKKIFEENDKPANDFLATVTKLWEEEIDKISKLNIRIVKLRIGVVLSEKGGALPKIVLPIKLFAGSSLGSGDQIVSWIDLDDLCNMFVYAIENPKMEGAYNAVAPNPVSYSELTNIIGKVLSRPIWPISVPRFLLKIAVGEMEVVIAESCNVRNKRIAEETDFKYQYTNITDCLKKCLV
jgi:uncharacterized protein (TIGR01777 family)